MSRARTRASLISELRALGLDRAGSIAVESVDVSISDVSARAEVAAPGSPADAIVWEEVQARVEEGASLSQTFILLMVLSTMIGAVGILTDSIVLIIGAMVVGPEYGPLAGVCVAVVDGRPRLAGRSLLALAVGFLLSIAGAALLTAVLVVVGAAPSTPTPDREITLFISDPNWASLLVAVLAGVVGMLALTGARSAVLVGVLISVTTIPAAANVGVAFVYRDWSEARGAALQLIVNLLGVSLAGLAVLVIDRRARLRRQRQRHATLQQVERTSGA